MNDYLFCYQIAVTLVLAFTLLNLALNLLVFGSLKKSNSPVTPRVSVLVPARNEAHRIGPCARSLAAQAYGPLEVLILDDNSEDDTSGVARQYGYTEGQGRLRLLKGTPLPAGWTGKAWACQQLAQAATGEYLLFTDADTEHAPETVASAMGLALRTRADLLSAWPRLRTFTLGEKLVVPLIHLLAVALYPHVTIAVLQRLPALAKHLPGKWLRSLGGANGQFILFKRTAYEAIGGHASVRAHMVEDVALGREIAERIGQGMRLVNCDGSPMVDCRMYESFPEVWSGFTKNLRPAFEKSLGAFLGFGVLQFCCFLLPFGLLASGQWKWAAVQVAMIYMVRAILAARLRTSWVSVLLHPVGHLLALLIALNSWRRSVGAGLEWKGRLYEHR